MPRTRYYLPIVLTIALVTAGCVGFSPGAEPETGTDGTGTTSVSASAQTLHSNSSVTDGNGPVEPPSPGSSPAPGSPGPASSYTALYNDTIDSVVEITVRTAQGQSQGSGFVYSSDGLIVTNQHVVQGASRAAVRFRTGEWRGARVVGTDVYTDLAVLRVESLPANVEPLPVARTDPRPGQPVVALGSPFGYEGSITHGIISGLNRSMPTAQGFSIPDTIQTDAPINPGNSGGPLVSMNGTVLGVNRAKRGDNVGFAISADVIQRVVPELAASGSYDHSFMGIRSVPVTPRIANANGLSSPRGIMVLGVLRSGPADGVLQPAKLPSRSSDVAVPVDGDIIVSVDGTAITSHQDLARYLLLHTSPGQEISLTVIREGKRVTETMTLGQRPELQAQGSV